MPTYQAPLADIRFVLHDVIQVERLSDFDVFSDVSRDLIDAILDEGSKFAENELFPLNASGDQQGCHYENGVVRTPNGFKQAYESYVAGGWGGLSCAKQYGGQGLPMVLQGALWEMMCSANLSFTMYPGLTHGAYDAIFLHGTDDQKNLYLPKFIEGSWSGTMCLTEPHCGTDLGLIKTKAVPNDDGSYDITGTKIFISAGDHDLTENIVHLVLARLPDSPDGTKGISLFVVPKFLPKENVPKENMPKENVPKENGVGPANGVMCGGIEHKMGIKASATCTINFEGSKGWLVGKPHKGMSAMFTMMNMARLGVGLQGYSQAELAYQNAVAYAKERLQGRSLTGTKNPSGPADPIIVHPDIRRMLLTIRAYTEGSRALAAWIGYHEDVAQNHPDESERQASDDLVALLTPIVKASCTDIGFDAANLAIQVYGGHGYITENGVDQIARDARITQIYEGTNGIQALDLVGRKLAKHMGRYLRRFFHPIMQDLEKWQSDPELLEFVMPMVKGFTKLQQATALVAQKGLKNPDEAGAVAVDYLRLFSFVAMGYMWMKMIVTAREKIAAGHGDKDFYEAKIHTGRFYMTKLMPQLNAHFISLMAGADPIMAMEQEAF